MNMIIYFKNTRIKSYFNIKHITEIGKFIIITCGEDDIYIEKELVEGWSVLAE